MVAVKKSRTASPDERRKQLTEATIESITKNGISGTTMRVVSQIAGLSLGLVNFHFSSKEALLEETLRGLALEHRQLWLDEVGRDDLGPEDKINAIVDAQFDAKVCNRRKLAVWFAFFGEAKYRKFYRKITAGIDAERLENCSDLFQRIADEGQVLRPPDQMAEALEGLFDGLWLNILMYPDRFSRATAREQVRSYLAMCCPGRFADVA